MSFCTLRFNRCLHNANVFFVNLLVLPKFENLSENLLIALSFHHFACWLMLGLKV